MKSKTALVLLVAALITVNQTALAQTPTATPAAGVLTTEGVAGDIDNSRRSPSLSVRPVSDSSGVKLLVDTYVPNSQFAKYPIRIDFFVNRRLFASQIRSPELPGALGVDISKDVAAPPFNYTVVATVLHPNRQYTTVMQGAIYSSNFSSTLDCTLTIPGNDDAASIFEANNVTTTQEGNGAFSLSFVGTDATADTTASITTTVTINGSQATATLAITQNGQTTNTNVTGSVTSSDGKLESFELESSDGNTALSCS